ncbi:MAG: TetR/AcrR family transcriptional regulator [Enterobacterales bacterium]|nr:TetR/AcrR family transcriptional regulator [Enterobacterales bacterium]
MSRLLNKKIREPSARGRPIDQNKQDEQKSKLLDAAQKLLQSQSYRDITIRALSQEAQINSAMVSYYFDGKEGLFLALLDRMSGTHFNQIQRIAKTDQPIRAFIHFILKMLNENNGFARFIYDEFDQNQSQLGDAFIKRFPTKMAQILPNLILKHTAIRDKRQAKFAAFTLMSMVIMPFVGRSIRQKAWKISDDDIATDSWAEHIYKLFIAGCGQQDDMNNIKPE